MTFAIRLRAVLGPAVCVVLLAAGCGSGSSGSSAPVGNGESAKTAPEILSDVQAAVSRTQDVHMYGSVPHGPGSSIQLNLHMRHGSGAGTMVMDSNPVRLIRIGNAVYMKAGPKFWQNYGSNPAVIQLLQNRWFKFPATDARYAGMAKLLDEGWLIQAVLKPSHGVAKVGTRMFHGQQVVVLRDTGDQAGGELYVATTGAPYPVALIDPAKHAVLRFDSWNQTFPLSAPAGAVDISQFSG